MSPDHARALAQAYELLELLHSIVKRGFSPKVDAAIDLMDGVLDELDALGPDHGKQTPHSLRLLVTEPRVYEAHRITQAQRALATTPWRRP
jgi:hypothetical protein